MGEGTLSGHVALVTGETRGLGKEIVWNCSQIFGRGIVARGHGSIINIGPMSGLIVDRPNNKAQPGWLEEGKEEA